MNDSTLGVATEWLVVKCGMEPCTVMIRIQFNKKGPLPLICKWCAHDVAHWQRAQHKEGA